MSGMHNVENARRLGRRTIVRPFRRVHCCAIRDVSGVKRRQEPRGYVSGALVIDDFAHHPTATRNYHGIRQRYPDRRLGGLRAQVIQSPNDHSWQRYAGAFDVADVVTIRRPEPHDKVPADQQLDVARLSVKSEAGIETRVLANVPDIVDLIVVRHAPTIIR
jgi:UDP-N-acetylmuramate: L-alanyl-gamma-D-glutamyl-meso-diaminopimelate ligase